MGRKRLFRLTRRALGDLTGARDFLRARNPSAARKFSGEVRAALAHLRRFPAIGPVIPDGPWEREYRSVVVGNHRIVYRVNDSELVVLRVWDCRQDPAGLWHFEDP